MFSFQMPKKQKKVKKERKPLPVGLRIVGKVFSFLFSVLATLLAIFIITGCIVAVSLTTYVMSFVDVDQTINLRELQLKYTTILYAGDEEAGESYELKRLQGDEDRVWVNLEDIPQCAVEALISVEDERFYQHNGVDWKRTFAAFLNEYVVDLWGNTQGGSTITQQLVKNITGEDAVRIERKLQEIFTAIKLEKEYSKDDILEAYLNRVHFGNNTNGIEAASNLYFGKSCQDLTIAEAASIIGITQWPTKYDPFTQPEANKERQEWVLAKMYELGKITKLEYEMALVEKLNFVSNTNRGSRLTWFEDAVIFEVVKDLVEQKGYSETYALNQIYNGGYRIYTTLDPDVQSALDEVYANGSTFPAQYQNGEVREVQPESAAIVMDYTGAVRGLIGGRKEKNKDLLFNLATQAQRQPGSTMKPIGVYGPAIENNLITYSTVIKDAPIQIKEGGKLIDWPVNYYNDYYGDMVVEEALQRSTNTIAVRVGQLVTPSRSFEFLTQKLHISTLVENRNGQSDVSLGPMCLGSVTDGVTLEELVAAYQIYGNGGLYNEPHTYTKVTDYNGNVLLENKYAPERAVSEETSTVMNKLLQRVVYGRWGTGYQSQFSGQPLGGKTGTTSDNKDHWYIGLSPYYVAGVWWGYEIPEELIYYNGIHPPMQTWKAFMSKIHADLPTGTYPESNNVVQLNYCTVSGLIASSDCPSTAVGYYKADNIPQKCDHGNLPSDEEESSSSSDSSESSDESSSSSSSSSSNGGLNEDIPSSEESWPPSSEEDWPPDEEDYPID